MTETKPPPATPEEIRERMASIRYDIDEDVQEIVDNAKLLSDWTYYLKQYPWVSLGVATLAGYALVPSRKQIVSPDQKSLERLAKRNKLVVQTNPKPTKKGGLTGSLVTIVSSLLVRGVTSYIGQQAGKVVGQKAANEEQQTPEPSPPSQGRPNPAAPSHVGRGASHGS